MGFQVSSKGPPVIHQTKDSVGDRFLAAYFGCNVAKHVTNSRCICEELKMTALEMEALLGSSEFGRGNPDLLEDLHFKIYVSIRMTNWSFKKQPGVFLNKWFAL